MEENKKKQIFKIVNIILVLVWMIAVFMFSSEEGYDSADTSGKVIKPIVTVAKPNLTDREVNTEVKILQPYVRKLAHFILYTIGGFVLYGASKYLKKGDKVDSVIIAVTIGIMYAISDETHQLFVGGRGASLIDVGIDSMGVILGCSLRIIMDKIIKKIKHS